MNTLILTMLLTLCGQLDVQECPQLVVKDNLDGRAIAQMGFSKNTGQGYVFIDGDMFDKLNEKEQKETLVHELAHGKVWEETGKTSHNHGHKFKVACKDLIYKTDDLSVRACKKDA